MDKPCEVVADRYTIADGGIVCDHFLLNVLPLDSSLNDLVWYEIRGVPEDDSASVKPCTACRALFIPSNNRQKYCSMCAKEVEKKRNATNHRNRYWKRK